MQQEGVEEIVPYLKRFWLADGRIVGYRVESPKEEIINQWAQLATETLEAWNPDQPYLAIHDLTTPGVSFAYSRQIHFNISWIGINESGQTAVDQIKAARPKFISRLAVILSLQHSAYVVKVLSSHRLPNTTRHAAQIFFDQEKATNWLLSNQDSVLA